MSPRSKSICKKLGCSNLVDAPGYCQEHLLIPKINRRRAFDKLDEKKTKEEIAFYGSWAWKKAREVSKARNPLCEECLEEGIRTAVQVTHHEPPYKELIAKGLNPLAQKYLHSTCNNHHLKHLRAMRQK